MSSDLSYCRLCARPQLEYDIIDISVDSETRHEIIEKLAIFSSNPVDFTDRSLPETICMTCCDILRRSSEFLAQIQESQDVLYKLESVRKIRELQSICPMDITDEEEKAELANILSTQNEDTEYVLKEEPSSNCNTDPLNDFSSEENNQDDFESSAIHIKDEEFIPENPKDPVHKKERRKKMRIEIIALWEQKKSKSEIARQLGVARKTVGLWVNRFQATGHVKAIPAGPQPVTFTDKCNRHREILKIHTLSPSTPAQATAIANGISKKTVLKHLRAARLQNRYQPPRKMVLTELHRQARVKFARQFLNFDWRDRIVIFTDEIMFRTDIKDGRKVLWRRPHEMLLVKNVVCSSERISLGYWCWLSSMGPGELIKISGRTSTSSYLDLLKNVLLPTVRVAYPEGQIYLVQEDYSAVHHSPSVTEWLQSQDIKVIDWPSKSPDLNLVEKLWSQMLSKFVSTELESEAELEQLISSTWESTRGSDSCWNMVNDMQSRLELLIKSGGDTLPQ